MPRSPRNWFRKTTWSSADELEFRACLKRARAARRPQYLKLQASHLIDSGLPEPALVLLDEFLRTPDDTFLAQVHGLRGRALTDVGRLDEAIAAYRAAIEAKRRLPNVEGYEALEFAELIVATRRARLYDEALDAIAGLPAHDPFPLIQYREAAVRAQIADARGDRTTARREALRALQAAAINKAPFARHPTIGLVREVDPNVYAQLVAMCAV